jgi:cytochrome c oxidase cbb3-type subunit 3
MWIPNPVAAWRRLARHPGLRRWWPRLALALALVLVVGGGALWNGAAEARLVSADPDSTAGDPSLARFAAPRGARLFRSHCSSCHGSEGRGDYARGAPDLTDHDWLYGEGRVSDIERVVQYGIRMPLPKSWNAAEMPAYARPLPYPREPALKALKPAEIEDVVAFLRRVEGQPADAMAVARGGEIFHGRGGCYDCHTNDAGGDTAIGAPNLTDRIFLYGDNSAGALRESIAYGRAGLCPGWKGKLSAPQIREVAIYVHNLALPGATAGKGRP